MSPVLLMMETKNGDRVEHALEKADRRGPVFKGERQRGGGKKDGEEKEETKSDG